MLKIQMLEQIMNNEELDGDKERATNSRPNTLLLDKTSSVWVNQIKISFLELRLMWQFCETLPKHRSLRKDSNWSLSNENFYGASHLNSVAKNDCLHNSEINHSTNTCEVKRILKAQGVANANFLQRQVRFWRLEGLFGFGKWLLEVKWELKLINLYRLLSGILGNAV
jgi:hypothetical protein